MNSPIKHPISKSPFAQSLAPKPCTKPLKPNPFECHRDPLTGRWITVTPNPLRPVVLVSARAELSPVNPTERVSQSQFEKTGASASQFVLASVLKLLRRIREISQSVILDLPICCQLNNLATNAATAVTAVTALWVMAH